MYISVEQSLQLDKIIKGNEVALRSFISDILIQNYPNASSFLNTLQSIEISDELIYSKRFQSKLLNLISKSEETYNIIKLCESSLNNKTFNNNVPYVSTLMDLLLLLFNAHFADTMIAKDFSSIEEFHYSCGLYHTTRNNLSHPASRPILASTAIKVIYFIENLIAALENKYFWYYSKDKLINEIEIYNKLNDNINISIKYQNLSSSAPTHKSLLCRDEEIKELYSALLENAENRRLAGSIVLYGYGGVGKTSITTEFLYQLMRDQLDGRYLDVEYALFFSSKDEYLRENQTTGQFYIDSAKPEFSTLEELQNLIVSALELSDVTEIVSMSKKGIIVIDNIENILEIEKKKIFEYMKTIPRCVHFIVTSRNEEPCEAKIHITGFNKDNGGINFIEEIIETEQYNVNLSKDEIVSLVDASKGNALIIVQSLSVLDRNVSSFKQVIQSLESMKSKNSEMIANFMYKNTFDSTLSYLEDNGFPVKDVLQILSLYNERIELYSISKLVKIDISDAEELCHTLSERLILIKIGEYYELNEFANRFIFTKLLPDRFELNKIKVKIKNHKERMRDKLQGLETTLKKNNVLYKVVNEWQPRNYIDKIVIAELFSLYGEAIKSIHKFDKKAYWKYLEEFDNHSFITSHPYVPLQKSRLLMEGLKKFKQDDNQVIIEIEQSYEAALESIEYDYRYLIGGYAHASLLMFFGAFLCTRTKEYSRSIRFLEDAKKYLDTSNLKLWFVTRNYLSESYKSQYDSTKDQAYLHQFIKVYNEVTNQKTVSNKIFDVARYKNKYKSFYSLNLRVRN